MKKFLTVLISLLMILSVVPTAVFAEEGEGEEKEAWEIYENYVYYNNDDDHKSGGYLIDCVFVFLTDEFCASHENIDASCFPDIAEKIDRVSVGYFEEENEYVIEFCENSIVEKTFYTEQDINEFIDCIKYLEILPYVKNVQLNISSKVVLDTTETEPVTEAPEPDTTEPVTTETTASETTSAEKTEENKLKNHQTGDNLIFAVSIAFVACAALTAAVVVKGKKRSENK